MGRARGPNALAERLGLTQGLRRVGRTRGPRVSLENLEARGLEASVDVSTASEGFFSMDVRLRAPEGLSKIAVQPSRVSGSLELLVARSVPVRLASFESRPPGSQDLNPLRLQPRFVTASGRPSQASLAALHHQ